MSSPERGSADGVDDRRRRRRRRRWPALLVVYFALLGLSHLVRLARDDTAPPPPPGVHRIEVAEQGGDGRTRVGLAWHEWSPRAGGTPLVLLHGSPGSGDDLAGLGRRLAADRRVIAPDLPGFGASQRDVADYSARAHAGYVLALADRLGIERFHAVGFSLGGAVALEIYDRAPERIASLTLLSATAVQELELLGDYRLNHALHGAQLAAVRLVRELVPHFGTLDRAFFGVPYARNFYDTDQRPLRGVLERFEPPALVVHGEHDPLVPVAAAWEHHRLLPQSRIELFDSDHFMVFRAGGDDGSAVAMRIRRFLRDVDTGRAPTRAEAAAERRRAAAAPFDPAGLPSLSGLSLVVVMALLAAATLVSEDLTCVVAGLLVAQGRLPFAAAAAACAFGIWTGDMLLYLAGRAFGPGVLRRRPLSWWIDRDAVDRAAAWFGRRGVAVIFASRFLPGARLPTYVAAGVLRTGLWRFSLYFALAVAVWTPALVGLAALAGDATLALVDRSRLGLAALLALAVLLTVVLRLLVVPAFTHAGRRRLYGRWLRWRHWEFWPPWLVYPPIVLWVLWLAVRHRGLTVFTAANPAMPAGGFIDEPKDDILRRLEAAGAPLPAWTLLSAPNGDPAASAPPGERRIERLERFRRDAGLGWPLVLKPNVGQRGAGVAVVRDPPAAEHYLEAARVPTLAQEHVAGVEAGVFWVHRPGEESGEIISVTEKRMPAVTGDGRRTIGELILDDDRAVALADLYLHAQGEGRERVPAAGERVRLVEIGTHCRGAVFVDGRERATPELAAALDRIGRRLDGFHFGRYDLRAGSWEELAAGRFRVIELNGVSSEMTHVYDRRHSLLYAWRTLARQWRLAFEIGAANRDRGAAVTPLGHLVAAMLRYRRRARGQGPAAGTPPPGGPQNIDLN